MVKMRCCTFVLLIKCVRVGVCVCVQVSARMSEQVSIGKLMCVRVGTHPVNLNVRV